MSIPDHETTNNRQWNQVSSKSLSAGGLANLTGSYLSSPASAARNETIRTTLFLGNTFRQSAVPEEMKLLRFTRLL
jgi:hypothetical protein